MKALKTISLSQKQFIANGTEYFIESSLSIERYSKYEQYQIELGYGVDFEAMAKKWQDVYDMANKIKFADIAVLAYNTLHGIQKTFDRESSALKLCALFINSKDEDRRIINDDMISKKINDWKEEGLEINSFFQLALSIIPGFTATFKQLSRSSLTDQENE